jgi:hypothetical protein
MIFFSSMPVESKRKPSPHCFVILRVLCGFVVEFKARAADAAKQNYKSEISNYNYVQPMSEQKLIYVTFHGIPLSFKLEWPFHPSTSGADYQVLHGNVALEDGSDLHAPVAVHMSQTVKEALPSVDEKGAFGPAINAIRKAVDTKDIEFLKSDKRQPIPLSSRAFSLITRKFTFQNPNDDQLFGFLKRSIYWRTKLGEKKINLADPVEALYLTRTPEQVVAVGEKLAEQKLITLDGNSAIATDALMAQGAAIQAETQSALEEINAKHAFERA